MDFPGIWQHFTIPVNKLEEEVFEDGLGFDGSSIRGGRRSRKRHDPGAAARDRGHRSVHDARHLSMICNIQDPITREDYSRDPRNVARKAVNYLKSTGIADTCYIGPKRSSSSSTTFVSTSVRTRVITTSIASKENGIGPGRGSELVTSCVTRRLLPRAAGRSVDGHPQRDDADDDRLRMDVEAQHHEVATAGQCEIDLRFQDLVKMADYMCMYKYIIKNVAKKHNKTVTFMPSRCSATTGRACTPTFRCGSKAIRCSREAVTRA